MEVCWLIPWAVLLGLWTDARQMHQLLNPLSIAAIVLLGSLSTLALGRRAAGSRAMRLGLVGMGVLVSMIAVRLDQYSATNGLEWLGLLAGSLAVMLGQVS